MAGVVEVRGVKIGEGIPKIIVPIVGVTKEEIVGAARALAGARKDLVEWRAGWFENVMDFEEVELVLGELRDSGQALKAERKRSRGKPMPR